MGRESSRLRFFHLSPPFIWPPMLRLRLPNFSAQQYRWGGWCPGGLVPRQSSTQRVAGACRRLTCPLQWRVRVKCLNARVLGKLCWALWLKEKWCDQILVQVTTFLRTAYRGRKECREWAARGLSWSGWPCEKNEVEQKSLYNHVSLTSSCGDLSSATFDRRNYLSLWTLNLEVIWRWLEVTCSHMVEYNKKNMKDRKN